jgi:hypothetical protein
MKMKKNLLPAILLFALVCASAGAQQVPGVVHPGQPAARSGQASQPSFPDMKKFLDSVYRSDWNQAGSSWILTQKEYKIMNSEALVVQDQFLSYDTSSGQWVVARKFINEYFTGSSDIKSITGQLLNTQTGNFVTYQYTHYSSPGVMDEEYSKNWDQPSHLFTGGSRKLYQYNGSGFLTQVLAETLDYTTQDWLNGTRTTYMYTLTQKLSEVLLESWNITSTAWVKNYRWIYTYDASDFLVLLGEQSWDDLSTTWVNSAQTTYTNNGYGLPTTTVLENWNEVSSSWIPYTRTTNTYNQSQKLTQLLETYNPSSMLWSNSYYIIWTYYTTGNDRATTGAFWDAGLLKWTNNMLLQYDSSGYETEEYLKNYDPQTYEFTGGYRYSYGYDAMWNKTSYLVQNWNTSLNDWSNTSQDLYTYDALNLLTLDLMQQWNSAQSGWVNYRKWDYYYNEFIGIGEISPGGQPCVFENPLKEGSTIRCSFFKEGSAFRVSLYNVSGEQVYSEQFRGNGSFTIPGDLPSGMYLLVISRDEEPSYQVKVILVR